MATVKLSIGQVNITNYLLVRLFYTDDPVALVSQIKIAPEDLNAVNNIVFDDILPKPVFVEARESVDGEDAGNLLSTFQIDVNNKKNMFERRFYIPGGIRDIDPPGGAYELTDPYFEGKEITGVFVEGYRYLKDWKDGEEFNRNEWRRVGNSIQLINPENGSYGTPNDPPFNEGAVFAVELSYLQDQIVNESNEPAVAYEEITDAEFYLSSLNRRKWNILNGLSSRMVLIAESIATIPDGDWYGFVINGGNQYQTVFKCSGADSININGSSKSRIVFGKTEVWKIYKRGESYDIINGLDQLKNVGRFFKSYNSAELNALPCDGVTRNGDDYPRIWDYIQSLPVNFAVNSATVTINDFGCWHYWETGGVKYFKTPNKQNMFSRNLKSFSVRNNDIERSSDYPGFLQLETVGRHRHLTVVPSTSSSSQFPNERGSLLTWLRSILMGWLKSGGGAEGYYLDSSTSEPTVGRTSEGHREVGGTMVANIENRPANVGEFEYVCI